MKVYTGHHGAEEGEVFVSTIGEPFKLDVKWKTVRFGEPYENFYGHSICDFFVELSEVNEQQQEVVLSDISKQKDSLTYYDRNELFYLCHKTYDEQDDDPNSDSKRYLLKQIRREIKRRDDENDW